MTNIWFISDTHFGDKEILKREGERRPFINLKEMHEEMIYRWNEIVAKKDTVYHLGDFALKKSDIEIAGILNGKKKLIMGNNDIYPIHSYLGYFDTVHGVLFYNQCILSHMPVHPNHLNDRNILNIHGHLHSRLVYDKDGFNDDRYFNVSCEQNFLKPINWDDIKMRLNKL